MLKNYAWITQSNTNGPVVRVNIAVRWSTEVRRFGCQRNEYGAAADNEGICGEVPSDFPMQFNCVDLGSVLSQSDEK